MKVSPWLGLVLAAACGGMEEDQIDWDEGLSTEEAEARGGHQTAPTVAMAVSPNPVPAWGTVYTISGAGFTPGAAVNFVINGVATFTTADQNGFASSIWTSWYPGSYTAKAKQFIRRSYVEVGSITYAVIE